MTHPKTKALTLAAALAGLAAPAAAQNMCGGGGQWIGGGEGSSDIATSDTYREQMALVLSGNEYTSVFSLSAPTSVRVEAAGRGNGDPLIDLMDADGNIIVSDDDSGGNGAARAELDLDPGTYCMTLVSYDGAPMTAFVRIGRTEHEPLTAGLTEDTDTDTEPMDSTDTSPTVTGGGSCADAPSLGVLGGPLSGTASVDDTPYWRFTLNEASPVSITAANEDADPVIVLYDDFDSYLDENDDFDGLNSRIDMSNPLAAGDYCIEVTALNDPTLPIEVEVSVFDAEAALQGLFARGEASPPLDGSYPVTDLGALSGRLRHDAQVGGDTQWFSVDVVDSGLLLVEAIAGGTSGDPWLVMFDDLGRQIGLNDDYGDGLDSLVTARVTPGSYVVGVKQVGGETQGLVRMVFEPYVPAP